MQQRPFLDFTDPRGLRHVPVAADGRTAVFHRIDETVIAPRGSGDTTVSFRAVADVVDPHNWYPDLYDHGNPPSLLGGFHSPEDRTPCRSHAIQRQWLAAGDSATQPPAPLDADWFRAELAEGRRDNSLRDFHRRTEAWLQGGTVPAPRREVGQVLDTGIFTTVGTAQFGAEADAQSGATR
jgi:hypothetical protein